MGTEKLEFTGAPGALRSCEDEAWACVLGSQLLSLRVGSRGYVPQQGGQTCKERQRQDDTRPRERDMDRVAICRLSRSLEAR